jgi:hypothetical protein
VIVCAPLAPLSSFPSSVQAGRSGGGDKDKGKYSAADAAMADVD